MEDAIPDGDDLLSMTMILAEDVHHSQVKLRTDEDSPYVRRVFARAVFSQAEGMCAFMKQQGFVRCTNDFASGSVALGPMTVYAGETYSVSDSGDIRRRDLNLPFIPDLFLSLKAWAFAIDSEFVPSKGDQWHRVKAARDVRNRITHPKRHEDLNISDEEVEHIEFFQHWFMEQVSGVCGFPLDEIDLAEEDQQGGDLKPNPDAS